MNNQYAHSRRRIEEQDPDIPPPPKNKFLAEIKKNLFLILALIAVAGYFYWDNLPKPMPLPTISAAQNIKYAPQPARLSNVAFNDARDRDVTLGDFYGKPKIMVFYRSECVECWPVMRSVDFMNLKFNGTIDVLPIALTAFPKEQTNQISRNYKLQGVKSLKMYNLLERDGNLIVGSNRLPLVLLLDRDGNLVGHTSGAVNWDVPEIEGLIQTLIAGQYVFPDFRKK